MYCDKIKNKSKNLSNAQMQCITRVLTHTIELVRLKIQHLCIPTNKMIEPS